MPWRTFLAAFRELVRENEREGNEHGRIYTRAYALRLYLHLKRSNLNDAKETRPLSDSIRAIDSSFYNEMLHEVIVNIPGADSVLGYRSPMHLPLDSTAREFVRAHHRDLVEYFLINLLWIGTPDEKTSARAELTTFTGNSYSTPEEWSEWWRGRYR